MKYFILTLSILSILIWSINYFNVNRTSDISPQLVLESDYQGRQLILRNINLYPNVPLARLFQNKAIVVTNKYLSNFFDLIDPNYYFFGSHPREMTPGQNYTRLPLLTLLPILWFLFKTKNKNKKIILSLMLVLILALSIFINHFKYDFVMWIFFLPIIYLGMVDFYRNYKNLGTVFSVLFLTEIFYELGLALR